MEFPSLNKIVTSFFLVFEHPEEKTIKLRPGLDLLAATLVRSAAHKLYIPDHTPRYGPSIEESIKQYPPILANKIKCVDRDKKIYNKVFLFLRPVYEEVSGTPLILVYNSVFDFLYKLSLASDLQAWADVSQALILGSFIDLLKNNIENEEAKFKLDELYGIFSLYKTERLETLTLFPKVTIPSIYQRISDLLNEAEIVELSKNRYLLGIPSKVKVALIKIKKWKRNVLTDGKYMNYIKAAMDLIQIATDSIGLSVPVKTASKLLSDLLISKYNPPIIDLDYCRVEICRLVSPKHFPNFILPDGATRGMTEEYFQRYLGCSNF